MSEVIINKNCTDRGNERATFQRHLRKISAVMRRCKINALAVVETVLFDWSCLIVPGLTHVEIQHHGQISQREEVADFVRWLASKEMLEAAYWISSAYSIWAGGGHRKAYSMYFTPPAIVNRMLDDLIKNGVVFETSSFFDPACGGAAFLVPIAQRIKASLYKTGCSSIEVLHRLETSVFGADLDPYLCKMSKFFLRLVLAEEILTEQYEPKFQIRCENSLSVEGNRIEDEFDVVICNPPYRKLLTLESREYRGRYGAVMQNQANLYSLFISLCIQKASRSGLISLLTPTSYFSGKSFANLRKYMLSKTNVCQIGIIDQRSSVFLGVEQDTALTLLQKVQKKTSYSAQIFVVSEDGGAIPIGRPKLSDDGRAWPLPRNHTDSVVLASAASSSLRLIDYGYKARIGAFVWNRDKRNTYSTLNDALQAGAIAPVRLLWSSDISTGGFVDLASTIVKPEEAAWLDVAKSDHPSVVKRPAVVLQRVTSNDQRKRLIAAVVENLSASDNYGFVGENHVVILESIDTAPEIPPSLLASILVSKSVDRYFRCISGANNVSIYELSQLPLPCPYHVKASLNAGLTLDEAVESGYLLKTKGHHVRARAVSQFDEII